MENLLGTYPGPGAARACKGVLHNPRQGVVQSMSGCCTIHVRVLHNPCQGVAQSMSGCCTIHVRVLHNQCQGVLRTGGQLSTNTITRLCVCGRGGV
eukprot:360061-Chlamydomonas_euryale.AAC.2